MRTKKKTLFSHVREGLQNGTMDCKILERCLNEMCSNPNAISKTYFTGTNEGEDGWDVFYTLYDYVDKDENSSLYKDFQIVTATHLMRPYIHKKMHNRNSRSCSLIFQDVGNSTAWEDAFTGLYIHMRDVYERYDVSRGTKFSTYCVSEINSFICNEGEEGSYYMRTTHPRKVVDVAPPKGSDFTDGDWFDMIVSSHAPEYHCASVEDVYIKEEEANSDNEYLKKINVKEDEDVDISSIQDIVCLRYMCKGLNSDFVRLAKNNYVNQELEGEYK